MNKLKSIVVNIFCKTGQGGGIDPSCGTGKSSTGVGIDKALAAVDSSTTVKPPSYAKGEDWVKHGHPYVTDPPYIYSPSAETWKAAPVKTVNIKDLIFQEKGNNRTKLKEFISKGIDSQKSESADGGIKVVEYGGRFYLADGNHRVRSSELLGGRPSRLE